MTLALARQRIETPVPPVFEQAFRGETGELPGYEQPHVIVERLALVAPGTLQTRFYTSAYAAELGFKPVGNVRFRFPNSHSLSELVQDLHRQLSTMEIKNTVVPENIDEKTEFAAIEYNLQDGPGSELFEKHFQPLFYGLFEAFVHHFGAVQIPETKRSYI